ncbi:hypothetical protein PLEOSDRAFT_28508 [Pleurotus ostreatus PC15]|uniref:DUF6699 domain-containing protein n=1 Tax=Pleurotus ostreatus (strain PC15) TaxID=1137138 RepID=A0A067NJV0_PLEO1|nr:hypothetical protein PLEOSDRAFT_28508 [Pleurotus ostreatus PC15]
MTRKVRFSDKATVHHIPAVPPLSHSPPSPASSGSLPTPPNLPYTLPGSTPYPFVLPPKPAAPLRHQLQLHAALAGPQPNVLYDCSYSPSHLSILNRHISPRFASESATYPPTTSMTISSPSLPWTLRVTPRHGVISVSDVLYAIYDGLRSGIYPQDFESMTRDNQKRVRKAYENRYRRMRSSTDALEKAVLEKANGVKRVDFLMGHTVFMGLAPTRNPIHWVLITSK